LVDQFYTVSEDEIRSALRLFIESHHMLCEGAAAAAIAGLLQAREAVRGATVAVVICGANISADHLKSAL
jgi:threonine dehydratase